MYERKTVYDKEKKQASCAREGAACLLLLNCLVFLPQSRVPRQGAGQMRTVHGVEMDAFDAVLQKVLDLLTGVL